MHHRHNIFKYYRVVRLMKVILVHILQRSKDMVCWSIITPFAQIKSPNKSHNLSLVITSICIHYYSFLMMRVYCFSFLMTKIKVVQYLSQSQERLSTSETNTQARRRSYTMEYTHSRKFSIFMSKYKLRKLHHLLINLYYSATRTMRIEDTSTTVANMIWLGNTRVPEMVIKYCMHKS